jgi:putative CocE/NonD family hydrolase
MDYQTALRQYEGEQPVRILFENGAGAAPGAPVPVFEASFPKWPPPDTQPERWYFGPNHTLPFEKPNATAGDDRYRYDPGARPATDLSGNAVEDTWKALPPYDWQPLANGKAVAYVSDALPNDTVMIGSGSVDLWIEANAPDVDLQVTLTEVRADGKETYVQSGWLRASHRKLDKKDSTELRPRHTHSEPDAQPLPRDRFAPVRVELFALGHVFRVGSRIRISVEAPGGDRPRWKFDAIKPGHPVTVRVARSADRPSSIVLPVVPGIIVPTPPPPCPALRGQPCREYVPLS